jgi:hypothetical protein
MLWRHHLDVVLTDDEDGGPGLLEGSRIGGDDVGSLVDQPVDGLSSS